MQTNKKKFLFILIIAGLTQFAASFDGPGAKASRPQITVWIHGTTVRAILPIKTARFHFSSKLMNFKELRPGSQAYKRAILLAEGNSKLFPVEQFYLFRWNGMLDDHERFSAAKELYHELLTKIREVEKETGQYPDIKIIAHSHGGNIALYLAQLNDENNGNLKIEKLILLACPVQDSTASFAQHKIFNQIYAFYSKTDLIQVLALQKFRKFAKRKFDQPNKNLVHIRTRWAKYDLFHNDFKSITFASKLPDALKQIDHQIFNTNQNNSQKEYLLTL